MSLINQMLKDLEKRASTSVKQNDVALGLHYFSTGKDKLNFNWKTGILFGLIAITALLLSLKLLIHTAISKPIVNPTLTTTSPIIIDNQKTLIPVEHTTPTILTGITLQILQDTTSMRLLLSQNALYRIVTDLKHHTMTLVLDHAHILTSLPPMNYQNSAIKNMEMVNAKNGDLKIILSLNMGAELQRLELNEAGKFPELQIDLANQQQYSAQTDSQPQKPIIMANQTESVKKLVVNMVVDDEYKRAKNFLAYGQAKKAIELLTVLLSEHPAYYPARESLAALLIQQGRFEQADELLKVGLQQNTDYIPFIEMRARLLADTGKTLQALALLQRSSPNLAEEPDYYALIAALYQRNNEPQMAAKLYEQLLTLNSSKGIWWIGLGIALDSLNKTNAAAEAFHKANNATDLTPELRAYAASRIQDV